MNLPLSDPARQLKPTDPAIPCGLVAKSFFNDTYRLYKRPDNGDPLPTDAVALEALKVEISETQIAWQSDIDYKFKNIYDGLPDGVDYEQIQWIDMKNNGKSSRLFKF